MKSILKAITWKNEDAEKVIKKTEKDGTVLYEADSDLRDSEKVPLDQDIQEYFQREVIPHVPDAWIDDSKTKVGYEIPFNRHFYKYIPPRSLEDIDADLDNVSAEIMQLLQEVHV